MNRIKTIEEVAELMAYLVIKLDEITQLIKNPYQARVTCPGNLKKGREQL